MDQSSNVVLDEGDDEAYLPGCSRQKPYPKQERHKEVWLEIMERSLTGNRQLVARNAQILRPDSADSE